MITYYGSDTPHDPGNLSPSGILIETGARFVTRNDQPELVASGSGVHFNKNVTFIFSYNDRMDNTLTTSPDISSNPFIGKQQIDILTYEENVVHTAFYSGVPTRSFTFTEQDNIDVFGSYSGNFAIKLHIDDPSSPNAPHKALYKTFCNVPSIQSARVQDGSGLFIYEDTITTSNSPDSASKETFSGDNPSTAMDERTGNRDFDPTSTPITGEILIDLTLRNSPLFTRFDFVEVYATTGIQNSDPVDKPETIPANLIKTIPMLNQSSRQQIRLGADVLDIGDGAGSSNNKNYNFTILPYSSIGAGHAFGIGPHSFVKPVDPLDEIETDRIRLQPLPSNTNSIPKDGEGSIYYDSGTISTTSSTVIDIIQKAVHHHIHYMIKIEDNACNVYTTNIIVSLTNCENATDYEIQEYGQSSNMNESGRPLFCLNQSGDTVVLDVEFAGSVPYTYSFVRTSL